MTADILTMSADQWEAFAAGLLWGYLEGESVGFDRGYRQADAEMAALQRHAVRVMRALADCPEVTASEVDAHH